MKYRQSYIIFYGIIILSGIRSVAFSQNIKAEADKQNIYIGEQVKIKLVVEQARPGMPWFNLPDSVNHFEIISRSKIDTTIVSAYTNYSQDITVTSFDSGRWQFPALAIAGLNRITLPITIDVLPVDVSKIEDYNDIKDIVAVNLKTDWWITALIAFITLLSIGIVYWLYKNKKVSVSAKPVLKGNLSPLDWALVELNKLKNDSLISPQEIKVYYTNLSTISKTFFEMQFQQQPGHLTTDEWMVNLQPLELSNEIKTAYFQVLRLSDTVKFAKYLPLTFENETSMTATTKMLQGSALLHSELYNNYQP